MKPITAATTTHMVVSRTPKLLDPAFGLGLGSVDDAGVVADVDGGAVDVGAG